MSDIRSRVEQYEQAHKRLRLRIVVVACLVFSVVALTSMSQFLTAYTQTKDTFCGLEHEHSLECYSNPDADVEKPKDWERSLPKPKKDETEADRLVAIAKSQLGYRESTQNYVVDGDEIYGYTRYGEWLGDPYATWNEAFVLFCLDYAGIDEYWLPLSDNAWDWVDLLIRASEPDKNGNLPEQLFYAPGDANYDPQAGDLVFYDANDGSTRVGIIEQATRKDSGKSSEHVELKVIEGDSSDAVKEIGLHDDKDKLVGYGVLPKELHGVQEEPEPEVEPEQDEGVSEVVAEPEADAGAVAEDAADQGESADQDENVDQAEQGESAPEADGQELGEDADEAGKDDAEASEDDAADQGEKDKDAGSDKDAKAEQDTKDNEAETGKDKDGKDADAKRDDADKKDAESDKDAQLDEGAEGKDAESGQTEKDVAAEEGADEDADSKQSNASLIQTKSGAVVAAQTLRTEVDGYQITVELMGVDQEGLMLQAMPLDPTTEQLEAVAQSLSEELEDGATKKARVEKRDVRAFDICVVDAEGNEVSLDASARVSVMPTLGLAAAPVLGAATPEVVHLGEGDPEHLATEANTSGFAFETDGFSSFVFVYTVDFEYQGYAWSMPGGSSLLLSTVLGNLGATIDVADVTDVAFSGPSLIEVTPSEGNTHDWLLTSLQPFKTHETLTLTLADGSTAVIDVTDAGGYSEEDDQNLSKYLTLVEFLDGDILVGSSKNPDNMVARPGHEYTMRLYFKEVEEGIQFPETGEMIYVLDDRVHLAPRAFKQDEDTKEYYINFDISLGRTLTLTGNKVVYVPKGAANNDTGKAYLKITWNEALKAEYKELIMSPRAEFMLSFPYTTVDGLNGDPIEFSSTVELQVDKDSTYDVTLEKRAMPRMDEKGNIVDRETIDYEVIATADGDVTDIILKDEMGIALQYLGADTYPETYPEGGTSAGYGLTVEYRDADGELVSDGTYDNNITNYRITKDDDDVSRGFSLELHSLRGGHTATFKYSAHVNYALLGGKENIEVTSRNTVRATDADDNVLAEAHQKIDKNIDYLQVGKSRAGNPVYVELNTDEDGKTVEKEITKDNSAPDYYIATNWSYAYVPWKVIYNPDREIDVEGAVLTDTVWKGRKYGTTYDTTRPFTVTAYKSGTYVKDSNSSNAYAGDTFTPGQGDEGVTITTSWKDVKVQDYNQSEGQFSSWEWTIPEKDLNKDYFTDNEHYTYVVEYWTKIDNTDSHKNTGGYVGNRVTENIADITRDRTIQLPGIEPSTEIEVEKTHLKDDYVTVTDNDGNESTEVYSQWEIKLDCNAYGRENALVEDTLPHTKIDGRIHTDTFVNIPRNPNATEDDHDHGWQVYEYSANVTTGTNTEDSAIPVQDPDDDGDPDPDPNQNGSNQDNETPAQTVEQKVGDEDTPWIEQDVIYTIKQKNPKTGVEEDKQVTDHTLKSAKNEYCMPRVSLDGYDINFEFYKSYSGLDNEGNVEGLYKDEQATKRYIIIQFWTKNDATWIDRTYEGKAPLEHWNHAHLVLDGKEAVHKAYGVPKPATKLEKKVEPVGTWTNDEGLTLPIYRYTLVLNGMTDQTFAKDGDSEFLQIEDQYDTALQCLRKSDLYNAVHESSDGTFSGSLTLSEGGNISTYSITLNNKSDTDETLVRTLPAVVPEFTGSGEMSNTTAVTRKSWPVTSLDVNQVTVPVSSTTQPGDDGQNQQSTTTTMNHMCIKVNKASDMLFPVMDEDGKTPLYHADTQDPVMVYGKSYEVSYYLAPSHAAIKQKAQEMVLNKDYTNTTLKLENRANWIYSVGDAVANEATADIKQSLNPVDKKLLSYDPKTETARYRIVVNPLRLRMNEGQWYSVTDEYTNLAVDFKTITFTTVPATDDSGKQIKDLIEWSYHNNVGTFWVPDETKVVIEYEGWPVGRRGNQELNFTNKASLGGYTGEHRGTATLSVDHEGQASNYRVRIFKFADDNMNKPLSGSVFQLLYKDADGNIQPMKYKRDFVGSGADITQFNRYGTDDDAAWKSIAEIDARNSGILVERDGEKYIPTPERHKAGDNVYFITGKGGDDSEQAGFAEVVLNQSQDGISLKLLKQYYLREVLEPTGHIKENIDWRFIIGENDDFPNYVYSNDSILQISNASADRVLTVRKNFVDHTSKGTLTNDEGEIIYNLIKDTKFEIVGTDKSDPDKIVYNRTATYNDFMRVTTPRNDGSGEYDVEWLLIINELPDGNYTVKEVRNTATVADTSLVTYVDGNATRVRMDDNNEPVPSTQVDLPVTDGSSSPLDSTRPISSGDAAFGFEVTGTEKNGAETILYKTNANVEFTNVYTDQSPVTINVAKSWDPGERGTAKNFTPIKAEFELLRDGVRYDLSADQGGNANGNLEISAENEVGADGWLAKAAATNLPRYKADATTEESVWTVREVSATYQTGDGTNVNTTTVTGAYLHDHFSTTYTVEQSGNQTSGQSAELTSTEEDGTITFTNKFNNLTSVTVNKEWGEDAAASSHTDDVVYFDLYRTTTDISTFDEEALRNLVTSGNDCEHVDLPEEDIKLSYSDDSSKCFTYHNDLLEKTSASGGSYHYFAIERSVAGYDDSYPSRVITYEDNNKTSITNQAITITNTPHSESEPKGTLTIQKKVMLGDTESNLDKTFRFTLWNSGKYLVHDASGSSSTDVVLVSEDDPSVSKLSQRTFTVRAGEPLTLTNVKLGTYILTEVEDDAQIGGYKLNTTEVSINGADAVKLDEGLATEVEVKKTTTSQAGGDQTQEQVDTTTNIVVTNKYVTDDSQSAETDFTFGKVWVTPDVENSMTLIWPDNINITMRLGRRNRNTGSIDTTFNPTYTITRGAVVEGTQTFELTATPSEGAKEMIIENPDAPSAGDSSTPSTAPVSYHHYKFTVKDLPKYDANGNEWEYFARESAVVDNDGNNLLSDNPTGRKFVQEYGYIDGVGAESVDAWKDAYSTNDSIVRYAINRLDISQTIDIPVKKLVGGRYNLKDNGLSSGDNPAGTEDIPPFTFGLYDLNGKAIETTQGNVSIPVTKTTDANGEATFNITEYIDLNDMIWWSDEEVLAGKYDFYIKEEKTYATDPLVPLAYNGIKFTNDSVKVSFYVKYNWQTGEFTYLNYGDSTSSATPHMPVSVLVNNYDSGKQHITVKKHWDDENNRDGYRTPATFKITAYYYGDDGQKVELNEAWLVSDGIKGTTYTFPYAVQVGTKTDDSTKVTLPKYYEGHVIYYNVEEVLGETYIAGQDTTDDDSDDVTLENKYDAEQAVAKAGNTYYNTLAEAVNGAESGATITLVKDVDESNTVVINRGKTLTIDMGGHTVRANIDAYDTNVTLKNGTLSGTYWANEPESGSGSLTVSSNATIQAPYGIVLYPGPNNTANGYTIDINGTVDGMVWVMGTITSGSSTINVNSGAKITGDDVGLALNGAATVNVNDGAEIVGTGTGIEVRAGTLKVTGGTITGQDTTLTVGPNGSGTTTSGAGIAIAQHTTKQDINVSVSGGTITGAVAFNQADPQNNATNNVQASITGGTFVGTSQAVAVDATSPIRGFVSGGEFSSAVDSACLATGYVCTQQSNGTWTVAQQVSPTSIDAPTAATDLVYDGSAKTGVASDTGYTVEGGTATEAGDYIATVTLADGYQWSDDTTTPKNVPWSIAKATISTLPTAVAGLVYNGTEQTGVAAGEGYAVTDGTATNAGTYTATIVPDANHQLASGTSNTVSWTIAKAPATVTANDAMKVAGASDPTLTATVTGTFGTDQLSYTVTRATGDNPGSYSITASVDVEQGNYNVTYNSGTFTILPESTTLDDDAVAYTLDSNGAVVSHNTLAEAVAAASANGASPVVRLVANVSLDSTLEVNTKVIIDGSNGTEAPYTIQPSASATSVNPLIKVSSTGDLTLGNVTIDAQSKGRAIVVSSGKLTLNDGAQVTGGTAGNSYIGGVYMTGRSTLTMNGGKITANAVPSYTSDGYLQYTADLWIGSEATGTMNGGTVGNLFVNSNEYAKPAAGFTQNGGTITHAYVEYDRGKMASLTHNSGTLSTLIIAQDDASTTADGNHVTVRTLTSPAQGTYTAASAAARIGEGESAQYYTSFKEAVEAAQTLATSGEQDVTVTMLADATLDSMITLDKNLTIDLNGHTLARDTDTGSVFQVVGGATLTIDGATAESTVVGRLNAGAKDDNNGNLVLNGGTYRCGSGQTVVHVNGTCTKSNVTINGATITSPDDNGIQLNGAGTHVIQNSTISGATAVYLKAGTLTVAGSTLTSTATGHTAYDYNGNGSNPTGDAIVVDSCAYPGGAPTVILGAGNTITVQDDSGNVQVGYYTYNTGQAGYKDGVIEASGSKPTDTLPEGYAWFDWGKDESNDTTTYRVAQAWTVTFDPDGGVVPAGSKVTDPFASQQVADGWKAAKPSVNPTRVGMAFLGWYEVDSSTGNLAETAFNFNTPITQDVVLQAKWESIPSVASVPDPYFTNTHEPETINVSVKKLWEGKKPKDTDTVTVRLKATFGDDVITYNDIDGNPAWSAYKENFEAQEITLAKGADDKWAHVWSGLPKYAPGQQGALVTYTVEEIESSVPLGYHLTASDTQTGTAEQGQTNAQTITNTYESVNLPIQKKWEDDHNRDGLRKPVTFTLSATVEGDDNTTVDITSELEYKNGAKVTDLSRELTSAQTLAGDSDTWTNGGWTNLPKYYQGKEIAYTVTETMPSGWGNKATDYENNGPSTSGSTRTITNTHEIYTTQLVFTKTWDDDNNRDGKRPSPEDFLKSNVYLKAVLQNGESPVELKVGEKTTAGSMVYKLMSGANQFGNAEVEITGSNGSDTSIDSYNTYIITYRNLPRRRDNGTTIEYTLNESGVTNYSLVTSNSVNSDGTITISAPDDSSTAVANIERTAAATNKYDPEHIKITVTKTWDHGANNSNANKPTTATVRLVAKAGNTTFTDEQVRAWTHGSQNYGIVPQQVLTVDSASYTWQNLPMHVPGDVGAAITYSIEEQSIPDGYYVTSNPLTVDAAKETNNASKTIAIANTYEETKVTATKCWNDANNQDGKRAAVTFKLQESADGTTYTDVSGADQKQSTGVTSELTAVWEHLPAWKSGKRVYYRAVEINAPGVYSSNSGSASFAETHLGTTGSERDYEVRGIIENSYTPEVKSVTFTKQWNHKGVAVNPFSTEQYKQTLHLWARTGTDGPFEIGGDHWNPLFAEDWKNNTTVTDNNNGTFTVTVSGLPVNKPKTTATDSAEPLEYFLTEGTVTGITTEANTINTLLGYYNSSYPSGLNHPSNTVGDNETLTNTRKTGRLQIDKKVISDLSNDASKLFTFTISTTPVVTGSGYTTTTTTSTSSVAGTLSFGSDGKATVQLSKDQSIKIDGLPIGVTYTVQETQETDFETPKHKIGSNSQETGASCDCTLQNENQVITVEFENKRQVNDLTISKVVHSSVQGDKTNDFKFQIMLFDTGISKTYDTELTNAVGKTTGSVTFTNGVATVSIKHDETLRIIGLPVTVGYTVGEMLDTTEATQYEALSNLSGSIDNDGETAAFTNTRKTSSLELTKNLVNAIPDDNGDTFYFDVTLKGDDNQPLALDANAAIKVGEATLTDTQGSGTHPLYYDATNGVIKNVPVTWYTATSGGATTITGLPLFATYSVSEVALTTTTTADNIVKQAGTVPASGTKVIDAGGETAAFTNTRKTGNLSIKKVVVSPVAAEKTASYEVVVTLKTKKTSAVVSNINATLTRNPAPQQGTNGQTLAFANGSETITITDSETVTISGIPTDVSYTVTEPGYGEYFDKAFAICNDSSFVNLEGSQAAGNIPDGSGETAQTQITNTRKLGNLTVTKSVMSAVASDKNRDFQFTVTMTGPVDHLLDVIDSGTTLYGTRESGMNFEGNTATFTLKHGDSKTATGLPIGWTYTVAESQADGAGGISLDKFDTKWTRTIGSGDAIETATGSDGDTTFGDEGNVSHTIVSNSSTVAFTNTRKTGTLRLVKTVNSPFPIETGAAENGYATYNFNVSLTMPQDLYSSEKITGEFSATGVSGNKVTFDANGEATVAVRGGTGATAGQPHYVEIKGLPIDVEYTVDETGFDSTIFSKSGPVYHGKVGDSSTGAATSPYSIEEKGGTYSVEITNTRTVVPVSLYKVSAINESKLGGAEFTLSYIKDANDAVTTGDDAWTKQLRSNPSTGCLVETSQTEPTQVFSLKPGTYQLVETKAPIGYHPLAAPAEFKVTPNGVVYTDSIAENRENVVKVMDNADKTKRVIDVSVYNSTGAELPSTGGAGPVSVYAGGALALMLAGIVVYLQTRKP